ncbi:uncharacterized protein A1O9_01372 [Exophiala aquamarina CBS 119918]|uniref:VWFA domain-containing protein n=1 Tax=Exophiala aquamarina CBS 119918 TaxID=1182545 RepID=A0A072Q648_9EURO|nr:uncharacterized protein A1O9_01372 [Exophiala aquamarina CBS 119918]KEF63395.1 hypothetical protein A1O9_01372 [Exophiala aquamarina CBS 119918]
MSRYTPTPSIATPSVSDVTLTDDWQDVDGARDLPLRQNGSDPADRISVKLYPLRSDDALIVSVTPPQLPSNGLTRTHCDIVLVIDVSGSMSSAAPLPDVENKNEREAGGLSILDLTKHAARTVLETMKDGDRLGIVTFSNDATIVQELTAMAEEAKKETWARIDSLHDQGCTNLWSGIKAGLQLFQNAKPNGNVQGLYVLTDGQPNHMCPQKGYANSLRPMLEKMAKETEGSCVPTIHTFGFGYTIRSDLMSSIAEVGNGSYAFIPDAGMIGTVFVHAVANLFTTFAHSATVELKTLNHKFFQHQAMSVPAGLATEKNEKNKLILQLGNIQYGQSRDIWIQCPKITQNAVVSAVLNFKCPGGASQGFQAQAHFSEEIDLPQEKIEYQRYRSGICTFLSSLFPLKDNGEHSTISGEGKAFQQAQKNLDALVARIKACPVQGDGVKSLIADLVGDEPAGQISKAMISNQKEQFWIRWGRHYLPSLLHAHQRQMCNTFKDPGPLLYGKDSPLFIQCRDELDAAFDSLPAPKPSLPPPMVTSIDSHGNVVRKQGKHKMVHMSRYNSSSNPCFEGNCKVTLADRSEIPVKTLRPGMQVWTPMGGRQVVAVLKTNIRRNSQKLCQVGDLLVTPWHPFKHQGQWVFPAQVADRTVGFRGSVYSVLLTPSRQPDAHAIEVSGQVCVTLGHGIMKSPNDARAHGFFGNYRRVAISLSRLNADRNGHLRCVGLQRDDRTGLACGFVRPAIHRALSSKALNIGQTEMRVACSA